jgi:hypothetical protein
MQMDLQNQKKSIWKPWKTQSSVGGKRIYPNTSLDYSETFIPVVRMSTIRIFLTIVATKVWNLQQLDVNTTFLHGELKGEVYMKIPQGLEVHSTSTVCRLRKSLYGLKQVSREWNHKLTYFLISFGYKQSKFGYSLFSKHIGDKITFILVYVMIFC